MRLFTTLCTSYRVLSVKRLVYSITTNTGVFAATNSHKVPVKLYLYQMDGGSKFYCVFGAGEKVRVALTSSFDTSAVLNLTDTVGVTQNFCSPRNFDSVWLKTRSGRKRMAWKWLCQLDEHYPHLAERARRMNEMDGFRMKYDPVEIKRREERERQRKMQRTV